MRGGHPPCTIRCVKCPCLTDSVLCTNGICQDGEVPTRKWPAGERERRPACWEWRRGGRSAPSILASVCSSSPRALLSLTNSLLQLLFERVRSVGGGGCERLAETSSVIVGRNCVACTSHVSEPAPDDWALPSPTLLFLAINQPAASNLKLLFLLGGVASLPAHLSSSFPDRTSFIATWTEHACQSLPPLQLLLVVCWCQLELLRPHSDKVKDAGRFAGLPSGKNVSWSALSRACSNSF